MAKKNVINYTPYIVTVSVIILLGIIIHIVMSMQKDKCPNNMVCLTPLEFKKVNDSNSSKLPQITTDTVTQRDYRVLKDPLYPPLNRTDTDNTAAVMDKTRERVFNVPTQNTSDTYRLVGYVVSQEGQSDMGGGNWKLFARQKDRNTSDFYMVPANNNYDIKVAIKDDMVVGTRLRDIYTIPNELRFNSPMLNKGTYDFIENPKTDFTSPQYI